MKHKFIFGLIYTTVYIFLAIGFVIAADNFKQFRQCCAMPVFFAPIYTWILIFINLYLLNKLDKLKNRIFFVLLLIVHYSVTILSIINLSPYTAPEVWQTYSNKILFTIGWYLMGQIVIWGMFIKATMMNKNLK